MWYPFLLHPTPRTNLNLHQQRMLPHTFQPFFFCGKSRKTYRQTDARQKVIRKAQLSFHLRWTINIYRFCLYFSEKTWCIVILYSFTTHDPIVCWCLDTDLLCHLYNDLTGPRVKLRLGVRALFLYCVHNISVGHWLPLIKSVNLQNQVKTKTSKLSSL